MLKNTRFGLGIYTKFTVFLFYSGISSFIFFPVFAFLIPGNGFSFPGENIICTTFQAIKIYSHGSFDPDMSKTFFSIGFVYFLVLFVGTMTTFFIDLEKKEECLLVANISKLKFTKKSHFFYATAFMIFSNIFLVINNFDLLSRKNSAGVFTGHGLSLHDLMSYPSAYTNYFLPMYHSRSGLATSGTLLILVGYVSIVGIPFTLRALRCFILANY